MKKVSVRQTTYEISTKSIVLSVANLFFAVILDLF